MAEIPDYIVIACWLTFAIYWLVSALRGKAIAEKQSLSSGLVHRIPLGCSYFLLLARHLPTFLNWVITPQALPVRAAGGVVCVLGLLVTLWARWTLAGNWSSAVTFKQGHELIRRGPYRFARHPIYTGILTMCLGTAIEIGRVRGWLAVPLMATAFWLKLKQEERLLLRHFPDDYPAYQQQVKALVPFVL